MARSGGAALTVMRAVTVALLCLLLRSGFGDAATYTVGDSNGWNVDVKGWPNGKVFRAGDVLKFTYDSRVHNVVAVDEVGYRSCTTHRAAAVFRSGSDEIKLSRGDNFFICNSSRHCQAGMKISITAL